MPYPTMPIMTAMTPISAAISLKSEPTLALTRLIFRSGHNLANSPSGLAGSHRDLLNSL